MLRNGREVENPCAYPEGEQLGCEPAPPMPGLSRRGHQFRCIMHIVHILHILYIVHISHIFAYSLFHVHNYANNITRNTQKKPQNNRQKLEI
jgi:hypothetical protein